MLLALAALLLLGVVAAQNYLYPPLRQETISDGLYGPYHWMLDGAYAVLAYALITFFKGHGFVAELLSFVLAGCLVVTAVSNTFSTLVDKLTSGAHSKIHTLFTEIMFVAVLALEYVQSGWHVVAANVALPAAAYGLFTVWKKPGILAGPAAEKAAVLVMCLWLAAKGLGL